MCGDEPPFAYLDLTVDFNGAYIEQSKSYIMIYCQHYLHQIL